MRHACHKPRGRGSRGRQGEEGKGGVPCVAPRCVCREGTARTGTRRQRAKDPGAWESGRGRTRGNEHTRGTARPENGSGGGQQGGRVASRIASPRASQSRERERRGRHGRAQHKAGTEGEGGSSGGRVRDAKRRAVRRARPETNSDLNHASCHVRQAWSRRQEATRGDGHLRRHP